MTRRFRRLAPWLTATTFLLAPGCGGSSTSPGSGTQTLFVDAQVNFAGGNGALRVQVERASRPVTDAVVAVTSNLGGATLSGNSEGIYTGTAAGWGDHYTLAVSSGPDHLQGTIEAPPPAPILAPDPTVAFDPHAAANGLVVLRWGGERADTVQLHSKDFEWGPMADPGQLSVAASIFVDTSQDVRVARENSTVLAGGILGSRLSADISTTTELLVVNPFHN